MSASGGRSFVLQGSGSEGSREDGEEKEDEEEEEKDEEEEEEEDEDGEEEEDAMAASGGELEFFSLRLGHLRMSLRLSVCVSLRWSLR
jgi:hypothetical protein